MNIINKLTVRHLKKNKRRTLVTIFGVIISVAMIMAVTTIGISFLDMFKRQIIVSDGAWEADYKQVQLNKLNLITDNEHIKDVALIDKQGFAHLEDVGLDSRLYKSYIEVYAVDDTAQQMYSIQLLEGRLPQNSNEIAIPEALLKGSQEDVIRIGEEVTLQLGERHAYDAEGNLQKDTILDTNSNDLNILRYEGMYEELKPVQQSSYTIVGIIKNTVWDVGWGGSHVAITALEDKLITDQSIDIVGVTFKEKKRAIFDQAKEIASSGEFKYDIHSNLLRYNLLSANDELQSTIYALTGIIMIIVIIGSVSLIYNAFGISVADRSKYLGMLASVGATKRQKRNSVLFEAGLISVISIPFGLLGGWLGLKVTFDVIANIMKNISLMNLDVSLEVIVTPLSILLSIFISLLTIFISSWLPARRASRISAIDAIRMSHDVKLTKRQVRNNPLVRKIFGLEADIALKNLKRNKRRYQITVFSLVISIILFISASYFTSMLLKANSLSGGSMDYDLHVNIHNSNEVDIDFSTIVNQPKVDQYAIVQYHYPSAVVPEAYQNDGVKKYIEAGILEAKEDGSFEYMVNITGLDDHSFNQFIADNQLQETNWYDEEQLHAVLINRVVYNSQLNKRKTEDVILKDALHLQLPITDVDLTEVDLEQNMGEEFPTKTEHVQLSAVVQEAPFGVQITDSLRTINIVMPLSQLDKLKWVYNQKDVNHYIYIKSKSPDELQQYILEQKFGNIGISVWNLNEQRKETEGLVLILNIFTYGFIALITFISLANIMNTISTGLQLRKREFAMLRSMGMTEKGFYRMINYESIFYGLKAVLYGIPISVVVNYLMYKGMMQSMDFTFELPWLYYMIAILGVFFIVAIVMYYAGSKIKKGSIVEAIKQENL